MVVGRGGGFMGFCCTGRVWVLHIPAMPVLNNHLVKSGHFALHYKPDHNPHIRPSDVTNARGTRPQRLSEISAVHPPAGHHQLPPD